MIVRSPLARLAFAAILAASLPVPTALAEKRIAITIGVDAYDNLNSEQQLRKAVNDSRAVGAALASVGFEIMSAENVPRLEFNRIWQRFLNRVEPGDTVSVFFAGHGVEIGGSNFLLPRDVPKVLVGEDELLKREAIGLSELLDSLRARQPKISVVIVDACRNNPFQQEGRRSVGGSRGLAKVEAPIGTFVMFSAGAGQSALDRLDDRDPDPNSVYTRRLLPLISQAGLSLPDLAQEVRRQVRDLTARVSHLQTPAYYDELLGRFCLATCGNAPVPPQVAAALPTLPLPSEPAPAKISAPNEPLPPDLPVSAEVLRTIETDPFFANAPPVRVGAFTIVSTLTYNTVGVSSTTSDDTDETTTRWLRAGLVRQDMLKTAVMQKTRVQVSSQHVGAGNGLIVLSSKISAQPRGRHL